MTSVLTNTGAMTALQVLNSTNKMLSETQGRISTGLKVATADQNAAIFALSGVMKADVAGFQTIQDGLGLAESAVSVARSASESISNLLKEMKTKIVSAQDGTQDRTKIQADIKELVGQISTIADSASFNGYNYLAGNNQVSILSSLNRATTNGSSYSVTNSNITFNRQDLVLGQATAGDVKIVDPGKQAVTAVASTVDLDIAFDPTVGNNGTLDLKIGGQAATQIDLTAATDSTLTEQAAAIQTSLQTDFDSNVTASVVNGKIRINDASGRGITNVATAGGSGDFLNKGTNTISVGNTAADGVTSEVEYTFDQFKNGGSTTYAAGMIGQIVVTDDSGATVATANTAAATNMGAVATALGTSLGANYTVNFDASSGKLDVTDKQGKGINLALSGTGVGKLGNLSSLDVTTNNGASKALGDIENLIQSGLSAASALGSTQKRLSIQRDFLGKLVDSVNTGIGTLVDADMTAESARLQSLQVQQQLGTQALGIANQQPQSILSLFRG